MSKKRNRKRTSRFPPLVRLRYARVGQEVWCEVCRRPLKVGDVVAWWPLARWRGQRRVELRTIYCAECHSVCVRAGEAIEGDGGGKRQATRPRRPAWSLDADRDEA
jgi:hypothetical protein